MKTTHLGWILKLAIPRVSPTSLLANGYVCMHLCIILFLYRVEFWTPAAARTGIGYL